MRAFPIVLVQLAAVAACRHELIRGRNVVVTGASRGLGVSIAGAFASEGATSVCLVARSAAALDDACASLSSEHPAVAFHPIAADVTVPAERHRVVDTALEVGGPVSVLVNNAGVERWGRYEESTADAIDEQISLNL